MSVSAKEAVTSISHMFCTVGNQTIPYKGHCENGKLIGKVLSRKILNNNRFWAGCGRTEHTKGNQTFNLVVVDSSVEKENIDLA